MTEQGLAGVRSSVASQGGTRARGSSLGALASVLRLLVGTFFLLAAGAKLSLAEGHGSGVTYGLTTFAAQIAGHHIVPEGFEYAAGVAAIVVEIVLGLWLLTHRRERLASIMAIVMLLAFCAYLIAAYIRVGDAPCGCMGKLTSGKLTDALVRNAGLIAVLLPSVVLGTVALPARPGSVADATS